MIMCLIESNPLAISPAWARIQVLVIDTVASPHTKRAYGRAVDEFLAWHRRDQPGPLSKAVVQRYKASVLEARGLAASSVNNTSPCGATQAGGGGGRQRPAGRGDGALHRQSEGRPAARG